MQTPLRDLPAVHRFTAEPSIAAFDGLLGHKNVRACIQSVLEETRDRARSGAPLPEFSTLREHILSRLLQAEAKGIVGVLNGTGVLLHTNFGRAPLAEAALRQTVELGRGYTNLEYDLTAGARGSRYDRVDAQLRELSGAQATLVVNNCAAAVLLVLDTFARNREVVVSRGQLIEIGGGFRLPDVLRKSGAVLVEVGTTNKTYLQDYRNAWTSNTAMFMRTHPSNYRVEGFTAEVSSNDLVALARELNVLAFEDIGSGALIDLRQFGLEHEPTIAEEIDAGLDLVAISGDKLLGGPQCGVICGREALIATIKRNPLLRALRVDKLTLAALSATLQLYLEPSRLKEIPFISMLATPREALMQRAHTLVAELTKKNIAGHVEACTTEATTGGGTLPLAQIPSAGIAVTPSQGNAETLAAHLREHRPPVVGRVEDGRFIIDLRCIPSDEDRLLAEAITRVLCTS